MWHRLSEWVNSCWSSRPKPSLGELGENAAVRFLKKKKYLVVDRNVQFREGEIDIVAVDGRTVVFVEVKTRSSDRKGQPWEAVDRSKQRKVMEAASLYLNREELTEQLYRFDIVSILWQEDEKNPVIEHLVDAFDEAEQSKACVT